MAVVVRAVARCTLFALDFSLLPVPSPDEGVQLDRFHGLRYQADEI